MDNYIMINGTKIELTDEMISKLGIKENNPFKVDLSKTDGYCIIETVLPRSSLADNPSIHSSSIDLSNILNSREFCENIRLRDLLNRKLLKYSYDHNAEDNEWSFGIFNKENHYYIDYNYAENKFDTNNSTIYKNQGTVYFSKLEVAEQAIEDVIKPFMEEHPEFVW